MPPNLLISLGTEAKVSMLKLFVIVSANSHVVLESWILALTSYEVFILKKIYCRIEKITVNHMNTNPMVRFLLLTMMMTVGRKMISARILNTKLSMTFSYEYANLFIFLTSEPEKLLVKNL